MSTRYSVPDYAVQILWGQNVLDPITLVNTGTSTVYIGDSSDVTAGFDLAIPVGGSMRVTGNDLWAICDDGKSSLLSLLTLYSDRFSYPSPVGRTLYSGSFVASTSLQSIVTVDDTPASQIPGVFVQLVNNKTGATLSAAGWKTGDYVITVEEAFKTPTQVSTGQTSNVHNLAFQFQSVGHITSIGETVIGGFFPNYAGRDILVRVTAPTTVVDGTFTVVVTSTNQTITQVQPLVTQAVLDVTGQTWTTLSNGYVCSNATIATNATTDVFIPNVPAPARVMVNFTQTGAGNVTVQLRSSLNYLGGSVTSVQWDANLITSTAAGTYHASSQYGVWNTGANFMRFNVAAGVTLSNVTVTIVSGVQ